MKLLQRVLKEESGQGLVEYGLLVAFIVVIVIAVLVIYRTSLTSLLTGVGDSIKTPE